MSTSTQNSNSPEKPNETALILEHVELLLALYEEQGEKHSGNFDQLLDAKVTEIAAAVERQIEQRFETLENQIERISESITAQNTVLQSIGDSAGSSPESTAVHEEYQRELETRLESLVERFSEKTDTTAGLFKSQIEQMFEDFSLKVSKLTNGIGHGDTETDSTVFDPSSDDTASHWHKQKEAMLSKYGIDPDYRPLMELPETLENTADEEEETAAESTTLSMSESDAAAIEELKERLNAKLRDAEVELSISRAKISQQQAELAEEQVELDRRAAAIEEKYAAVAMAPKRRMGFFRWLWHHLKPKQPEVNDRA